MSLNYFTMWLSIFLYFLFKGGNYPLKALFSEIWNIVSAFMLIPTAGSQSCWAHTERSRLSTESIQPCERIGRTALQKCESMNLLLFSSVVYLLAQVFLLILFLNLTYFFGTTVILGWFLLNWSYRGDLLLPVGKPLPICGNAQSHTAFRKWPEQHTESQTLSLPGWSHGAALHRPRCRQAQDCTAFGEGRTKGNGAFWTPTGWARRSL